MCKQGFFLTGGGPGVLSLDARLGLNPAGAFWGATALLVGLADGAIQLAGHSAASTHAAVAAHAEAVNS